MKKLIAATAFLLALSALSAQNPDFLADCGLPDFAVLGTPCLQSFVAAGAKTMASSTSGNVTTIDKVQLDGRDYWFSADGSLTSILIGHNYRYAPDSQESWLKSLATNSSIKVLPSRFASKGMTWEAPYDAWVSGLAADPGFILYAAPRPLVRWLYANSDDFRKNPQPHFTASLEYLWKDDPHYKIIVEFEGGCGSTRESPSTLINVEIWKTQNAPKVAPERTAAEQAIKALPEDDAFAYACSASLVSINKGSHAVFPGFSNTAANRTKYAGILRDSWGITTSTQLLDTVHDVSENGQSGSYRKLAKLIAENPGNTVPEIIEKESLGTLNAIRLFYVNGTMARTGETGIEAWDLGRCITLLRWSAGTGLITENTARAEIRPLIERIRKNYVSWEDYMAHYIVGRGFFGLTDSESFDLVSDALEDIVRDMRFFAFDAVPFPGTDVKRAGLSFDDVFYVPGERDWPWLLAQYSITCRDSRYQDERERAQTALDTARSIIPNDIGTVNLECGILLGGGEYDKLLRLIDSSERYVRGKSAEKEEVMNFTLYKLVACVVTGQGERAIETYDALPESAQKNPSVQYFTGFAYTQLHDAQTNVERRKDLFSKADSCFKLAGLAGMEIPESVTNWLEANRTE